MSEEKEEETLEEAMPVLEEVSVEVNEHHHLAYLGQQINQMNGQIYGINSNLNKFSLLHKDLKEMNSHLYGVNSHLYWVSLSIKISLILSALAILFTIITTILVLL